MPNPHMSQNQKREINGKRRNSQKELRMFPNNDQRKFANVDAEIHYFESTVQ